MAILTVSIVVMGVVLSLVLLVVVCWGPMVVVTVSLGRCITACDALYVIVFAWECIFAQSPIAKLRIEYEAIIGTVPRSSITDYSLLLFI